mgnify:CR=1 FL=1
MDIKSIKEHLGQDWTALQTRIAAALQSDIELLNMTNASILSNSGKQLRPLLSLLFARACSGGSVNEAVVRYAAASELLHNATLLHDDVADDSDQRRGVPTIRSLMGPSVSVLVGDYWLVKAMDLIMDADEGNGSGVMRIFSKTLKDLAAGEMLQLQKAQKGDTDEQDYLRIIYSKTASLFEATCVSAAKSVSASQEYVEAARAYAVALGIAFQIQDDILDYAGTDAVGKPLGADILEQKITMPLLGALANVDEAKVKDIRGKIEAIVGQPEYRDEILDFVRSNGGLEYAAAALDRYVAQAVESLSVLPESKSKEYLVELAYFTARRKM